MTESTVAADQPCPTRISDVIDLATVPLWHATEPNAAGLFGISRSTAFRMANAGELPTIHLRARRVVPVARLLAMLNAA
ncbi:MAG TPA: helix-turn-helix domain-containing protein [Gaiellaceae bacterium]|jgi:hypothetical protein